MNHFRTNRLLLLLTGAWALGGLLLRIVVLTRSMNAEGLVRIGSPALAVLMLYSLIGMGILTWFCLRLNRLPGTEACFTGTSFLLPGTLAAAALLLAGCFVSLSVPAEARGEAMRLADLAGVGIAVLMGCTGFVRADKSRFWLRLLPAAWALAVMILRFRSWTQDPLIIHIAPTLMAFLCDLLCVMLLSGFPLGAGHRRSTVLFGLGAAIFTVMLIPDHLSGLYGSLGDLLTLLGLGLWSLLHALALLRPSVQEETAPETPAEGTDGETAPEEKLPG